MRCTVRQCHNGRSGPVPRKAVTEGTGKRVALNMKTTAPVRARLEQAAAESGRSLTHEVEQRLEQSFEWERRLQEYREAINERRETLEAHERERSEFYSARVDELQRSLDEVNARYTDALKMLQHALQAPSGIVAAAGHAAGTSSATAVGEAVPVEAIAERTAALTVEKLLAGGIVTIRSTPPGEARV